MRARVPQPENNDFVVRPQSRIRVDPAEGGDKVSFSPWWWGSMRLCVLSAELRAAPPRLSTGKGHVQAPGLAAQF